MSISRIKTIVIFILLIVNIFFIFIYFVDKYEAILLENETRSGIIELLAKSGIEMDVESIPEISSQAVYFLERDIDIEKTLVESVLGTVESVDQGGNVYQYRNENGSAEFRSTGRFYIAINNYPTRDKSTAELSEQLLNIMGIKAIRDSAEEIQTDMLRSIGYICTFEDMEIFNCRVEFTYHNDGQVDINGNKIVGVMSYLRQADMLSAATTLVSFIKEVEDVEGIGEIAAMDIGYMMSANAAELQPVWRFVTDRGYIYIDAVNGQRRAF